jgi:NAD kinase
MARSVPPRAVVVTRPTDLEMMLLRHGTLAQARFFLESRGQAVQSMVDRHTVQEDAVHKALNAIPLSWRRARIQRSDLDRFLFEPDDVVIAVGQDGLVANVAKYLSGQPVVGVNPSKALFDGVLVRHAPGSVQKLLEEAARGCACEERTMVQATTSDGQRLVALNEVYVGHRTHQSSRYRIGFQKKEERHSSSGLIVCTGTGSTGWAKSVSMKREGCAPLPAPLSKELTFLVREPWPSVVTGTDIADGLFSPGQSLVLTSEMNDGGVVFGDGIEQDALDLPFGPVLTVQAAPVALRLMP